MFAFFMKELKGSILSQNHWRSQGGGPRGPGPLNRNATIDKNSPPPRQFLRTKHLTKKS